MNTTENNKLIAEFMDIYPRGNDDEFSGKDIDDAGLPYEQGEIGNGFYRVLFHKSWDWLMPVVYKIKWLEDIEEEKTEDIDAGLTNALLEQTFEAVVEFIKWYNENK